METHITPDYAARVEEIRTRHRHVHDDLGDPPDVCYCCGEAWPCHVVELLIAYDALREERDHLKFIVVPGSLLTIQTLQQRLAEAEAIENDRRLSRCEHGKDKVGMCCVKDLEAQLATALKRVKASEKKDG